MREVGIIQKVLCLVWITFQIKQLRPVLHVVNIFEPSMPNREPTGGRAHPVIFAQHRAIRPLSASKPSNRVAWPFRPSPAGGGGRPRGLRIAARRHVAAQPLLALPQIIARGRRAPDVARRVAAPDLRALRTIAM